jgi:hypothetical protein
MELLVIAIAAGIAGYFGEKAWWQRRLMVRRRVVVNLMGDRAITGVLWTRRGGYLVLKNASLLEPGAEPTQMDGDVLIDRERVLFVQAAG